MAEPNDFDVTTRFMLCNNEQFSSATTILNVFIVNLIWSEVFLTDAKQTLVHIQSKLP